MHGEQRNVSSDFPLVELLPRPKRFNTRSCLAIHAEHDYTILQFRFTLLVTMNITIFAVISRFIAYIWP